MTKLLELPLGPSVNALYFGIGKRRYTPKGRAYMENATKIKNYFNKIKHKPIDKYFYLDLYFTLPRTDCDSHNYKKALFDLLEHSGFVKNDKYIMDRTQEVKHDAKKPKVIISWEII